MSKTTIPLSKFISSSARYAKATVEKANVDGNANLTKAEAKGLPKDLQDNFEAYRQRGTSNGVVNKQKFLESYEAYVAATSIKADKNGDGALSQAEAKGLPADLQDNFAHFWAAEANKPSANQGLQTAKERLNAIYNKQLPASSELGELARALDSQLADNNIMSGVVGLGSGKLANPKPADADFKAWGAALMGDYLGVTQDGAKASGVEAKTMSAASALQQAGLILAEGNAYDTSNKENVRDLIKGGPKSDPDRMIGLEDLTKKLGAPLEAVVITGKVPDDNGYDQQNKVGMAIFLNTKTGEFVAFYGREGHV